MNFRLTLILVIVLVLLGSAFIYTQRRGTPAENTQETVKNALLSPLPKEIRAVSYSRDGAVQLSFTKDGSGEGSQWKLSAPIAAIAERYMVEEVAGELQGLTYQEKFDPEAEGPKSEAATGVNAAKHVIEFADDAGKKHKLSLGKRTIGGIYARLDGGKTIYLLSTNPVASLDREPAEFRAKLMAEHPKEQIQRMDITIAGQTVRLTKQAGRMGEGAWVISAPIPGRANAAVVEEVLSSLSRVTATGFTPLLADMPAVGMTPSVVTVTAYEETEISVTSGPAASGPASAPAKMFKPFMTLNLGYYVEPMNKKNVYAALGGSKEVFMLSAETLKKLQKTLNDLRDPAVIPVAVEQATRIQIQEAASGSGGTATPDGSIHLLRQNGHWQVTTNAHDSASLPSGMIEVQDFLQVFQTLRAIKFVDGAGDLKAIGLDPPLRKITLTLPNQVQQEVLLIGKPETADKVTPMMRQGESTVYLVRTEDAEKLHPTLLSLRDKTVERLDANRIRTLEISGEAAKAQTLTREGTKWTVKAGAKVVDAEELKITPILASFTPIAATKWTATSRQGLNAAPDVQLKVTLLEDAVATQPTTTPGSEAIGPMNAQLVTRTFSFWKKTSGGAATWQALYDGGATPGWVFEPSAALIDLVTKGDVAVTVAPTTGPAAATQSDTQPVDPALVPPADETRK